MNILNVIIQTLGGLGLFILGMKMMTEGLQMTAGDGIRKILSAVSSNRVIGCLTGAGVTAIIQSSSATTVMLISFVGAGMMTLQQVVGVILGANIGTTVTAQMIAFKLTELALPAISIGVVMKYFSTSKKKKYIGEVILGFGLLFYGMTVMSHGLSPIKGDPAFINFFTRFNPHTFGGILLCVATGAGLTILVQSSSATVGLTMTLASQGLIDFPTSMALVLGENIGTTITAELATIGSDNINSHRAARAHTMFNVIGVFLIILVFPFFVKMVEIVSVHLGTGPISQIVDGEYANVPRYIANGHSAFNIINALFFLIFLPWLIKVAIILSPKPKENEDVFKLPHFEDRFLETPIAALARVRNEIERMAGSARATLTNTIQCLETRDVKELNKYRRYEEHLDLMQKEIILYLTKIYQNDINESSAIEISRYIRMTNNIERIGDSVENIALMIDDFIEKKVDFTPTAITDIKMISSKVLEFMNYVIDGMHALPDNFMKKAQELEDTIDFLREGMRKSHVERLLSGTCGEQGIRYSDMLSNFEKMGDYCYNIAQSLAGVK
ncbi:MAG: Na/Pi cotransporter family protein [Proteobacteria bacterium]|nr:Na/Pi cotransporter family protein [Pseudomonadota bacterium]